MIPCPDMRRSMGHGLPRRPCPSASPESSTGPTQNRTAGRDPDRRVRQALATELARRRDAKPVPEHAQPFYGVLKTMDRAIRFALLTGVTKFGKVSVFSDLNNLDDISMREPYAAICGITETELRTHFDEDSIRWPLPLSGHTRRPDPCYGNGTTAIISWPGDRAFITLSAC